MGAFILVFLHNKKLSMSRIAVFPGSFSPFTLGHKAVIDSALSLFEKVIIAVGINSEKNEYFSIEERLDWINAVYANNPKIVVKCYEGLTVDFCKKEGASIVGGHTSKGKELTIGFTILGQTNKHPITIDGANQGDLIILTKPIGTGTILAGEMQGLAKGLWIKNAQDWMMKSQGSIIKFLANKVTSMTDVTGFGLYGHLKNICKSSNVSAILSLDEIPILEGALELSLKGVRSTIFEDNLHQANFDHLNLDNKKWPLLFDPQTSGGLLASVPKKHILEVQKKLKILGLTHSVIGKFVNGKATISY